MAGLPPRTLSPFEFLVLFPLAFLRAAKQPFFAPSRKITMVPMRLMRLTNLLLLLNPAGAAMKYGYIGPTPTSFGLVGMQSMAPRPTRPPIMDENNGELRKRILPDSIYSLIPKSWCAFVNGDFDTPISCSTGTCVVISDYLHTSLACSPYDDGKPVIYSLCLDFTEYASLLTSPSTDTTVCSHGSSTYCGIATLPRGEYFLFCDSTTRRSTISLEYLEDWYATGIITALLSRSSSSFTDSTTDTSRPTSRTSATTTQLPTPTTVTRTTVTSSSGGGLAAPVIAGIGVAIGAVFIGAIAGLGICCFLRRRTRKEGANQPVGISTEPSNPQMQQGNPGQGWQAVAPFSSPYPHPQMATLKDPEQPSLPYSSQATSIYKPHSSSISSPVTPYDSNGRTDSTGLYPLSQNPSATPSPKTPIPPCLLPPVPNPGELPRFSSSSDRTAQPPSPISGTGHHGGATRLGSPMDNQVHEMASGFILSNNPRGSVTGKSPSYHEMSSNVVSPTRQSSGTQSPPPLHPIHEAPQAYYSENQAHGIASSPASRQTGSGTYYESAHPPREISAGGGGNPSCSNSVSSNTGYPPPHEMASPTPVSPAVVASTTRINNGTYEDRQQAQYNIHEVPATTYIAYSPETSPVTRSPLDLYHTNNDQ